MLMPAREPDERILQDDLPRGAEVEGAMAEVGESGASFEH